MMVRKDGKLNAIKTLAFNLFWTTMLSLICQFKIPATNSHNLLFTFVTDTVRNRSGIATGKALIIEPFN
jgi:hypothetical protein